MKSVIAIAAAIATTLTLGARAKADVIITMDQVGSNVVAIGSGTIDLTNLTNAGSGSSNAGIIPKSATLVMAMASFSIYSGAGGPTNFGSGDVTLASSSSGDNFGVVGVSNSIVVPLDYVTGTPLAATTTWDNTTLAALGVMDGTYVWTWGTGPHADSLTLEIGSAVPEPSTWAMMIFGFCGLGCIAYRRRRQPLEA